MSSAETLAILITAGVGVLTVVGACMTFLVRMTVKWTRVEDQMKEMVGKVADLVEDKDKIHHAIYDAIKEDRRANNERLTYLERSVWPVSERRDFPKSRE